ncbi:alcohol acetyltransferase [Trametes punicea]|nr:alcohol acetyltransferase [Trametes punicea]
MSTSTSISQPIRQAGVIEAFFHSRTKLGVDSCIAVSARYESSSGRALDKATLFTALEQVVTEQPILSSRLSDRTPDGAIARMPSWIRLRSVDLNQIIEFLDADMSKIDTILETEFMRPFDLDADLPLWRLAILKDGTVLCAYDHAMGDGLSGHAFHLSLLAALQQVQHPASHSGEITLGEREITLMPPLEEAMNIPTPLGKIFSEVNQALNPFASRKRNAIWTGNPVTRTFELGVHVRVVMLAPEETTRLLRLSAAHGATLTGVLYVIVTSTLAYLLRRGPDPKGKFNSAVINVPISLRPHTKTPPTAICNYVSYYQGVHPLPTPVLDAKIPYPAPERFPWKLATEFSETLKREAPNAPSAVGVMRALIGSRESYFQGLLNKKRESTIEITNIGPPKARGASMDGKEPEAPTWSIQEMLGSQADGTAGAAFKVNVTGSPSGALGITLTWGKDALDEAFADSWARAFNDGLKALASTTTGSASLTS